MLGTSSCDVPVGKGYSGLTCSVRTTTSTCNIREVTVGQGLVLAIWAM